MERHKKFTIANNQEEFDCPTCGCPMYVGDRAVLVQADELEREYVTCSVACPGTVLREHERERERGGERRARYLWA